MASNSADHSPFRGMEADGESQLDEIIREVSSRLQNGEGIDLQTYLVQFPQYATRLERIVPSLAALIDRSIIRILCRSLGWAKSGEFIFTGCN